MVLAAGLGTRLRPLTLEIPKPVVPVLGRPLCSHAIEFLHEHGADAFLLNLHHAPEIVRARVDAWAAGRFPVRYSVEPSILGTGGGIGNAREFLRGSTFFAANADVIARFPLGEALAHHRRTGALATLVLFPDPAKRYTPVRVREDDRVTGFGEGGADAPFAGLYTGYQIAEPELLDHIPRGRPSCIVRDTYAPLIARGAPVFGYRASGTFLDFGTPADYLGGVLTLLAERVGPHGAFAHPGATLAADARLAPGAVVEEGACVGAGATVRRAIVWPGATVPAGATVEDGILTPRHFVRV
ncbi:MAG: sugar phosphate nucleotidyltransferase [Verrucomicrobiota bacterium]